MHRMEVAAMLDMLSASRVSAAATSPLPTVALADDDAAIREAYHWLLEDAGYPVVEAASGTDAVAVLRAAAQGCVALLDEHMPGLAGSAVVEAARNEPALRRHQYVLFTADASDAVRAKRAQLASLGVQVLTKPCEVDEVLGAIAAAAGKLL